MRDVRVNDIWKWEWGPHKSIYIVKEVRDHTIKGVYIGGSKKTTPIGRVLPITIRDLEEQWHLLEPAKDVWLLCPECNKHYYDTRLSTEYLCQDCR